MDVVGAPREMYEPIVVAWVKERNPLSADGIEGVRLVPLGSIATLAGESEVVFCVISALAPGNDVLNGMQLRGAKLGTDTVFAVTKCALSDKSPQFG
jgi:hypothetical protein